VAELVFTGWRRIASGLQNTMREYENRSAGRFSFFSETTADD
jgi:hypothetical protein